MSNLVGQKKLLATLDSYTLETLPHALLLIGEEGCGKHTFCAYLANRLQLQIVNVNEAYEAEDLDNYSLCPIPKLYMLDMRDFLEKDQNRFLKFIEEPSDTCFVVVLMNSEVGILDTILNRGIKLHFSQYTYEDLKQLAETFHPNFSELDYQICRTPGSLLTLDSQTTASLKNFCEQLLTLYKPMHYGAILEQYTRINCYENYDQFDFNAFLNMLAYVASNRYRQTLDENSYKILKLTQTYLKKVATAPKVSKHDILLSFFTVLYREVI